MAVLTVTSHKQIRRFTTSLYFPFAYKARDFTSPKGTLNDSQQKTILNHAVVHDIPSRQNIVTQGHSGDSMFLIEEGSAHVWIQLKTSQKPVNVAFLGVGAYFGEMALLTGEKRTATVSTITSLKAIELKKESLYPLFKESPEIMKQIADLIVSRKNQNADIELSLMRKQKKLSDQEKVESLLKKIQKFFRT